jgi:hypothetical protein
LSNSPSFKSKLNNYVENGGNLIVFAQQHGYEYSALPGDVGGMAGLKIRAVNLHQSISILTILYYQAFQKQIRLNVDGYFTSLPKCKSIAKKDKNSMPSMILYSVEKEMCLPTLHILIGYLDRV